MDDVSRRLEQIRERRGWSGREFSRRAGLGERHFAKIVERGGRSAEADTLRKLADAAGVSVSWLLTGDGEPFPHEHAVDSPSPEPASQATPPGQPMTYGEFPEWPRVYPKARILDPTLPAEVFEVLRATHPLWPGRDPLTPRLLVDLARVLFENAPPDVKERLDRERAELRKAREAEKGPEPKGDAGEKKQRKR